MFSIGCPLDEIGRRVVLECEYCGFTPVGGTKEKNIF